MCSRVSFDRPGGSQFGCRSNAGFQPASYFGSGTWPLLIR